MKERLDVLLVQKGYYKSRERAKASIMAGIVYINGQRSDKAGNLINVDAEIDVREDTCPYVSRGGLKLEKSIELWNIDLKDATCMDIGASTGGFTDCMLQNGAKKVFAVDVGRGQLDYKLRVDSRVINMEKTNIRTMDIESLELVDFISIDVSFISLKLVLPVAYKVLKEDGKLVCLVKPQFEAGREKVGKGGVVKDMDTHKEVIRNVMEYSINSGFAPTGLTFSPITGSKGNNIEYLLYMTKNSVKNRGQNDIIVEDTLDDNYIDQVVHLSHRELK